MPRGHYVEFHFYTGSGEKTVPLGISDTPKPGGPAPRGISGSCPQHTSAEGCAEIFAKLASTIHHPVYLDGDRVRVFVSQDPGTASKNRQTIDFYVGPPGIIDAPPLAEGDMRD
jgi:hypothetical protein